jgi:hypothetical protein
VVALSVAFFLRAEARADLIDALSASSDAPRHAASDAASAAQPHFDPKRWLRSYVDGISGRRRLLLADASGRLDAADMAALLQEHTGAVTRAAAELWRSHAHS